MGKKSLVDFSIEDIERLVENSKFNWSSPREFKFVPYNCNVFNHTEAFGDELVERLRGMGYRVTVTGKPVWMTGLSNYRKYHMMHIWFNYSTFISHEKASWDETTEDDLNSKNQPNNKFYDMIRDDND